MTDDAPEFRRPNPQLAKVNYEQYGEKGTWEKGGKGGHP